LELNRLEELLKSQTEVVTASEKKAEAATKARYQFEKRATAATLQKASLQKAVDNQKEAPARTQKSLQNLNSNKVKAVQTVAEAEASVVRARMDVIKTQMRAKAAQGEESTVIVAVGRLKRRIKELDVHRLDTQAVAKAQTRTQQRSDDAVVQADAAEVKSVADLAQFQNSSKP